MSNNDMKDKPEKLRGVKFDTEKYSQNPQGTFTLGVNRDALKSALKDAKKNRKKTRSQPTSLLPGQVASGTPAERPKVLLHDVRHVYIPTGIEKEKKSLMEKIVSRFDFGIDGNKVRKQDIKPRSKKRSRSKLPPPSSNSQDTKDVRKSNNTNRAHIQKKDSNKLTNTRKKQIKDKTEVACSTLRFHCDMPVVMQTMSNAPAQPNIVPLGQMMGSESERSDGTILNVRHIMIETTEKTEKKSFIKKIIPCLKSAKDEVREKYIIDLEEYFEVNDVECQPPKKLRKTLRDRLVSMIHTLI